MAGVHDHSHDLGTAPRSRACSASRSLAVVVLTAIGLFVWRPDGGVAIPDAVAGQGERVDATVTGTAEIDCAGTDLTGVPMVCEEIQLDITSGPNEGGTGHASSSTPSPAAPPSAPGDRIVVNEYAVPGGDVSYTFADYQRSRPLVLLLVLFVVAVIAIGRFQGLRALGGLVVSGVVLLAYAFPALLDGHPPLGIALVSSVIIAVAALYLSHGVNDTTTVALLGTLGALALTGVLAAIFTLGGPDHRAGVGGPDLPARVRRGRRRPGPGAGRHRARQPRRARRRHRHPGVGRRPPAGGQPGLRGPASCTRSGVRIGRDHIASVVNTLVLAYAGAALPLLLFYSNIGIGFSESITSEIVAVEVIRTLVGSIGLVTAVPAHHRARRRRGHRHRVPEGDRSARPRPRPLREAADRTARRGRAGRAADHRSRQRRVGRVRPGVGRLLTRRVVHRNSTPVISAV